MELRGKLSLSSGSLGVHAELRAAPAQPQHTHRGQGHRGSHGHQREGASSLPVTPHPSPTCDKPRGFVLKVAGKVTPAEERGQAALH